MGCNGTERHGGTMYAAGRSDKEAFKASTVAVHARIARRGRQGIIGGRNEWLGVACSR